MKLPVATHPISEIMKSGRPYIAQDLEDHMGFDTDQPLLNYGFRSYIDLPLNKQGQLIGTLKFLSKGKGNYTDEQVQLAGGYRQHRGHRSIECIGL
jgi:GAF domain-containing protein